ncbi:uncharacterized protein LOC130665753 isoform X2 [Microplitis mediator]|uniref:uncharacterized protein LOC130665753 isoform X2 n=2 Tax=Microplitis mediator TaxID=375433 RepID=UPI0025564C51|nr:uncharacterized protein LOC130665753 isoform X2 [Microplitis mediator]
MLQQRGLCILSISVTLFIAASAKLPLSSQPWKEYAGKTVYSRSFGSLPESEMNTVNVPYIPKPSFFPKFVDPKVMIAQKTELLKKLFGGLESVNYPSTSLSDNFSTFIRSKPINSKFGPFASEFGSSYPETEFNDFDSSDSLYQRKRSIITPITNVPTNQGSPPLYPIFGSIPEDPEVYNYNALQQYLPSVFGPFGPYEGFGAYGVYNPSPAIDPASIFAAKKTQFLDKLFKSLSTNTSAPETDIPITMSTMVPPKFWSPFPNFKEITTESSLPKSTVVPPGFWAPSSIIPAPGEYTTKVSIFLDKLFKSIANKTAAKAAAGFGATNVDFSSDIITRSLLNDVSDDTKNRVTRSFNDIQTLSIAKDAIVDSIIAELGSLKTDMFDNFNDLIMAQKLSTSMGKKGVKSTKAGSTSLYEPIPIDYSIPYKQKMMLLSEVFDTLTELQKNISMAVSDAIKSSTTEDPDQDDDQYSDEKYSGQKYMFNETFADAVLNKLMETNKPMGYQNPTLFYQPSASVYQPQVPVNQPLAPIIQPTEPFWMAYVKAKSSTPKSKKVKKVATRDIENDKENYISSKDYSNGQENDKGEYKRAVKMSMRQGYQSLPPGTVESVQAGGGSVPGHQGGGLKLLIKMPQHSIMDV